MNRYLTTTLLILICSLQVGSAEETPDAPLDDAISRGLNIVQKAAKNYPSNRQCFSCHHQTLPLLAMAEARAAGLEIDEEIFQATADFTHKSFAGRMKKLRDGRGIGGRGNTVSYGLWTLDIAGSELDETTAAMATFLLKNQRDDGRWVPPSNRPPLEESQVSVTVLASYYMPRLAGEEQGDAVAASVERARKWLSKAPLESHEDHVFRLWGLSLLEDAGDEEIEKQSAKLLAEILAAQREDGGWSQLPDMESDAYATGQTLYILHEIGAAKDSPAAGRGVEYLLRTQQDDGSWRVETRSRPVQVFFDNGDPHGKHQFISISATSWAAAALARAKASSNQEQEPADDSQSKQQSRRDAPPDVLPGTRPLTLEGDLAAQMVAGVDKFLLRKIDESVEQRAQYWKRDFSSPEAYNKSIEPNRKRLARILGLRDELPDDKRFERRGPIAKGPGYDIHIVRWTAFADVQVEGLLVTPIDAKPVANVIAIPDADQTPEQVTGLVEGIKPEEQFARLLAEAGARVIVPTLISRDVRPRNGRAKLTNREYIYRSAFELGRHVIGYELQKVLAAIDCCKDTTEERAKIGVFGYGEGGMLALYAAALDDRIDAVGCCGYFSSRQRMWREPIDRNVFGLLEQFGDAELVTMTYPRQVYLEVGGGPQVALPGKGGAPGRLHNPSRLAAAFELKRGGRFYTDQGERPPHKIGLSLRFSNKKLASTDRDTIVAFMKQFGLKVRRGGKHAPKIVDKLPDAAPRQARQLHELDRHNQALLAESPYIRKQRFWNKLDYSSVEAYEKSVAPFREEFKHEVIGWFDDEPLPFNPRTRKAYDEAKWVGYEVMLDLWPDVFCYGILCLPKNMKRDGSERRPVVVCQHGLEGRPQDIVTGDHRAYHDFASRLCERGFITFAPQNLYIGRDKFRTLQRKANPLGKTLFSIITPQHQQIVDWLQTLPYVDGERIGFYGLSYGGKTAMRVPPLVPDYKCVICSADFNDWVWKCASTRSPYSYVWTGEYEIFEWDLGSRFNYAEMAALIAPRPFMVERGHFDGVAPDERVAYEFAKVRHLYQARLKLPADRCQIEWFAGPHTIHGQGTFKFLYRHLDWPEPE